MSLQHWECSLYVLYISFFTFYFIWGIVTSNRLLFNTKLTYTWTMSSPIEMVVCLLLPNSYFLFVRYLSRKRLNILMKKLCSISSAAVSTQSRPIWKCFKYHNTLGILNQTSYYYIYCTNRRLIMSIRSLTLQVIFDNNIYIITMVKFNDIPPSDLTPLSAA